ncbi:MAG: hypothetical protein LUE93_00930 [Bacteroides sp.]|nr:hypothetical protein [Bacteroides sp.]
MIYSMWGGKSSGTMNQYTKEQLYKIGVDVGEYFRGRENVILITGGETTPHFVDTGRTGTDYDYEKLVTQDYDTSLTRPTMLGEHRYETGVGEDGIIQQGFYIFPFSQEQLPMPMVTMLCGK